MQDVQSKSELPVTPDDGASPADWHFENFRRLESTLILLNLCLLVSLVAVHALFMDARGTPDTWVVVLFGMRFIMQTGELMVLNGAERPWPRRRVLFYGHIALAVHLAFAAAVSLLSRTEDSHYTVLMVLPVVAAAFRYRFWWAMSVAAFAGAVGVFEVYLNRETATLSEYFEAVSIGLVFLLVSAVVRTLVRQLQREQRRRHQAIEALAEARTRLAHEEKLSVIGRLASSVAHEIRNPIAMIASSLAAVVENEDDPALRGEMFQIARNEAANLERFTGDFLAYARNAAPQREELSLDATLHYIAGLARAQAHQVHVRIEVPEADCDLVSAEPYALHQALLNLVRNAIDATPPGGGVRLLCSRVSGRVLIHVENDGAPISPDVAARLFEPFFTTKPRGTGLGLAIVQNTARAHGGDVSLALNEPDRVRFTLSLPDAVDTRGEEPEHGANTGT